PLRGERVSSPAGVVAHAWRGDSTGPDHRGGTPLPIRPFLTSEQFDQETLRILGVAFEQVCLALHTGDCADDVKQAIADKVIGLAKTGERNPDLLCERARMRSTHSPAKITEVSRSFASTARA